MRRRLNAEGLTAKSLCILIKLAVAVVEDLGIIATTTILIILIVIEPTGILTTDNLPVNFLECVG